MGDSQLQLSFFGPPRVVVHGRLFVTNRRKDLALLAYLAVTGENHQREALATLFWPEKDQASALSNLRKALSRLKKNPGYIDISRTAVQLQPGYQLDITIFQEHIAATRITPDSQTDKWLEKAVALYRGPFLAGLALRDTPRFDEWQRYWEHFLREKMAGALQWLIENHGRHQEWEMAIQYAQQWLLLDPLHEVAHHQLIKLYAHTGHTTKALEQYERCHHLLHTEMGIEPQEETILLYQQIKKTNHLSVAFPFTINGIPPTRSLPPSSRIPFRPNPLFVGRTAELRQLVTLFNAERSLVAGCTIAITGLGGVGKTQLAVEFAHRHGHRFPGGVFWLSFADPEAIPLEVAACGGANALALQPGYDELSLSEQVKMVQRAWQEPLPRLLIFDNCTDHALLTQWRPASGGCCILLTSRNSRWHPDLAVTTLPLSILERSASITLLQQFVSDMTHSQANAIAAELGDLPLALHLAGRFLGRYSHTIAPDTYLAQLRPPTLLKHPSLTGHGETYSPTAHETHIGRTFTLSYQQLHSTQAVDRMALQLLARAAYFAPGEPIPRALLFAGLSLPADDLKGPLLSEDGLVRLLQLGLLEERDTETLWIHRLLAKFVRDMMPDLAPQQAAERALLATLSQRLDNTGYMGKLDLLAPHLWAMTQAARPRADEQAAALCNWLGIHLREVGDYTVARPYLEDALAIRRTLYGDHHPDTAQSLNNLGWLLFRIGQYRVARAHLEHALTVRRTLLGKNHPDTAQSLNNLGWLLWKQGELHAARPLLERALAVRQQCLGEDHPETARSYNSLAGLLWAQAAYGYARPLLKRALAIREQRLGPTHPRTADSLNNFGLLLKTQRDYAGARPYLQRALAIREKQLGPTHLHTAYSLHNLGALLQLQGDYTAARPYLERALAIREQKLGTHHPDTAYSLNELGMLLTHAGEWMAAQALLHKALCIRSNVLGSEHPDTAESLHNLGCLLLSQGDCADAHSHLQQALAIREQRLGPDHPQTADTLYHLGKLFQTLGENKQTRSLLTRALTIFWQTLGPDHDKTQAVQTALDSLTITVHSKSEV